MGVHGRSSGAGILGALIVGGIIGSIIHDQQHQNGDDTEPHIDGEELQGSSDADELTNGYSIVQPSDLGEGAASSEQTADETVLDDFQQTKQQQSKNIEWHQVGKDGKCYLMGVNNGVTDVIAAVPDTKCKQ